MRIAFPNARRLFKKTSVMLRDARTYAIGMIEQERSIPLEMKKEDDRKPDEILTAK